MKTKYHFTHLAHLARVTPLVAFLLLVCAGFVFGCTSTPDSRIKKNQQLFDSLPPQAQAEIHAGQVGIGYTPDMVLLALGQPDRRYTRTTQSGVSDVWAYTRKASPVSFGLGLGIGGGRGIGTGVGVATGGGGRAGDRLRVIFDNGRVASVESATGR